MSGSSSFPRRSRSSHKFLTSLMLGGTLLGAHSASAQYLTQEVWLGVSGTAVSAIPVNTTPHFTGAVSRFEAVSNVTDNYGQRISGYLTAPTTGNYTFWIAGDDNVELWLSTTNSASDKVRIAHHNGNTASRQWNKYLSQKSGTIALVAGQQYYIEALMKEALGSDNLAVGWAKPGQSTTAPSQVIPGSVLSRSVQSSDVTYSFDDMPVADDGDVNGIHGGIDFGINQWGSGTYYGFGSTCGWFSEESAPSRTFTLPAGTRLKSIKLSSEQAGSTWSISDGVNPPISGTFDSVNTPITVATNWVNSGSTVTIGFSAGYYSGIDDIVYGE